MKHYIAICVFCLFCFSCQNRPENVVVLETIIPGDLCPTDRDSAKYLVFHYGDVQSYKRLRTYYNYVSGEDDLEILGYSWLMADTYNYPQAYFDIYFKLHILETYHHKKISPATRQFMIENLKTAAELGHSQAQKELLKLKENK